jgi:capsular polysaccharide biosynthesis protein
MTHPEAPRGKVVICDKGIMIASIMRAFLKGRDVVFVESLDAAMRAPESHACDLLLCSLALSHRRDAEDCKKTILDLGQAYRAVAYFEPSLHGADYLGAIGLMNFHSAFDINTFLSGLTVDFLLAHSSAYSVTHYGCNAAFDSSAHWVVPTGYPRNTFPPPTATRAQGDIQQFDRPMFEFSCLLCESYDSRPVDFDDDLFFIEKKVGRSPFHLSGLGASQWTLLRNTGLPFYETPAGGAEARNGADSSELARRCSVDQAAPLSHPAEAVWLDLLPPATFGMIVRRLENCVVSGIGAVIVGKQMIAESGYLLSRNALRDGMRRPHPAGRIDGLAILALNRVARNYYHWLVQILPLLEVATRELRAAGEDTITIVTTETSRFQREYIRLLTADFNNVNLVTLKLHEYVTVDQGLHCNLVGSHAPLHLIDEQLQLVRTLKKRAAIEAKPAFRELYISRNDGSGRTIKNEAELIAQMQARGLEILTLSELSVRDQMLAFSEARLVVGPHGAGLSNILFSSEQTTLIELLQSTYANLCMLRLAQNVGARHIAQFFFPDDRSSPYPGDWYVDVDRVCALVDRVRADAAERAAA